MSLGIRVYAVGAEEGFQRTSEGVKGGGDVDNRCLGQAGYIKKGSIVAFMPSCDDPGVSAQPANDV